jgi:TraX protein
MKLNAFQLKVIALVFMILEHAGRHMPELFPPFFPLYFEYAGRLVAPIFFFLAVESFFKTSNRRRYIGRLFTWAAIMQAGDLVVSRIVKQVYQPTPFFPVGQNIFLSIALGISLVAALEWVRGQKGARKIGGWAGVVVLALASMFTEASYNGLLLFIVFYAFHDKKPTLYYAYAALCLAYAVWGLATNREYFWFFEFQWVMITALPLIALYNGEYGNRNLKYLFYMSYPLHIWLFYSLGHAFGVR